MKRSSQNGFLVLEAIIALALFSICIFSTLTLSWGAERAFGSARSRQIVLDGMRPAILDPDDFASSFAKTEYGNDAELATISSSSLSFGYLSADTFEGYGKDTCPHDLALPASFPNAGSRASTAESAPLSIPSGDDITGMIVKDGVAYISTDSSSSADADLFIFDLSYPAEPRLVSSLDTGPGLGGIAMAGPYIFAAERSSTYQLQAIDIHDRSHPSLVSSVQEPLDNASSTRPYGSSVFYDDGFIYLGTEKGDGPELTAWSVTDPAHPVLAGRYEIGGKVEDIFATAGRAYIASTGANQLMVFDISNPADLSLIATYSPSGWQTQVGESVDVFEDSVAFGRDTGGFDLPANPKFLLYDKPSGAQGSSFEEPGGIYAIIPRPQAFIILTHRANGELRLDDEAGTTSAYYDIPGFPTALACDNGDIYVASDYPPEITFIHDFH